ncbi:MAG: DNA repair and recombination protein RadB [Candidatus Woesearchaeota archaeon]
MEDKVFSAGSAVFDSLLSGYEGGVLTTLYGPAGTGKTTVCLQASIATIRAGKKVIFVDTEGGFSTIRFQQLVQEPLSPFLEKIFLLKPMSFSDQIKTIGRLKDLVNESIGLVVVDSISMLYRAEIAKQEGIKTVNSELGLQLFYLNTLARKFMIPVLVTSQVYADFEERDKVKMVGGDILKYGSKCLIEIEKYKTLRKATIIKHRFIAEYKSVLFEIRETGFERVELPTQPIHVKQKEERKQEFPAFEDATSVSSK